jgi:prepilin-type N-terminal cleavage/methylation domain-containing protein
MKKYPRTYGFNGQGFTLIELMVVMLLITIVLAVVIPRFDAAPFQDPGKKFSRWMINAVRHLRATPSETTNPGAGGGSEQPAHVDD